MSSLKGTPVAKKIKFTDQKTVTKSKGRKTGKSNDEQTFYSSVDGRAVPKSLNNVYKILNANTAKNWYDVWFIRDRFCSRLSSLVRTSKCGRESDIRASTPT